MSGILREGQTAILPFNDFRPILHNAPPFIHLIHFTRLQRTFSLRVVNTSYIISRTAVRVIAVGDSLPVVSNGFLQTGDASPLEISVKDFKPSKRPSDTQLRITAGLACAYKPW